MASYQDFGTTLKVDNPGDAWFRRARGPASRRLQKEDICQAFTIAAFTPSCQANIGSLCLGPPRHCCLQPPHDVENCTVVHTVTCTWEHYRKLLLFHSRLLGTALRLSRFCLFRCHREIIAAVEAGTCAGSRAWNFSTSPFSLWPSRILVLCSCRLHALQPSSCRL